MRPDGCWEGNVGSSDYRSRLEVLGSIGVGSGPQCTVVSLLHSGYHSRTQDDHYSHISLSSLVWRSPGTAGRRTG